MIEVVEERVTPDDKKQPGRPDGDLWYTRVIRLRADDDPPADPGRHYWDSPAQRDDGIWFQRRTVFYMAVPELWALHNAAPGLVERRNDQISPKFAETFRSWASVVVAASQHPSPTAELVRALAGMPKKIAEIAHLVDVPSLRR